MKEYELAATISTESVPQIREALRRLVVGGSITETADGFAVIARMRGESARDLNRALLTALRKVEKKTRLRAEWTTGSATERFFDYVPKGKRNG